MRLWLEDILGIMDSQIFEREDNMATTRKIGLPVWRESHRSQIRNVSSGRTISLAMSYLDYGMLIKR